MGGARGEQGERAAAPVLLPFPLAAFRKNLMVIKCPYVTY